MANIKIDLKLNGVYTPGFEGPHAQFRDIKDAFEWGDQKFGLHNYEIKINYARWTTDEEAKDIEEYHANTAE